MRRRVLVPAGTGTLFAGLALASASPAAAPTVGASLPAIAGTTGRPIAIATFRGKTIIINFWASWCVPCRAELPSLDRLAAANPGRLVVVAASVDTDREAGARAFGTNYPHLKLAYASLAAVQDYGALGMPYSVVFDRQGKERRRIPRALEWDGAQAGALLASAGFSTDGQAK